MEIELMIMAEKTSNYDCCDVGGDNLNEDVLIVGGILHLLECLCEDYSSD